MLAVAKSFLFISALGFLVVNGARITIEQMQQATEPVKLVCIQKTKISEELLENLSKGKLDDQKELKCYVNCIFEMMQMMKKGKILYESVMKSIDTMMPEELADDTRRAVDACRDVSVGIKDNCESAFTMLKCIYKENPNFYFP